MQKLKRILLASRPISWINTAYPFAAAYIMTTRRPSLLWLIATIYFLFPYNLLMYGINDVFDYESDLRNPRKGGIEGAVLERREHRLILWSAALTNLPFLVYLLLQGSLAAKLVLLFAVGTVLAYSAPYVRFKERPLLDSLTSSSHFVNPMVYALVLTGWHADYWLLLLVYFGWGVASHAFGAVQDVVADRQAAIGSVATVFGARRVIFGATSVYVLSSVGLLLRDIRLLPLALCGLLYALNTGRFWRLTDATSEQAHAGWQRFLQLNMLTGFVLTMVLVAVYRHWFGA